MAVGINPKQAPADPCVEFVRRIRPIYGKVESLVNDMAFGVAITAIGALVLEEIGVIDIAIDKSIVTLSCAVWAVFVAGAVGLGMDCAIDEDQGERRLKSYRGKYEYLVYEIMGKAIPSALIGARILKEVGILSISNDYLSAWTTGGLACSAALVAFAAITKPLLDSAEKECQLSKDGVKR